MRDEIGLRYIQYVRKANIIRSRGSSSGNKLKMTLGLPVYVHLAFPAAVLFDSWTVTMNGIGNRIDMFEAWLTGNIAELS
jgi:hypothetical protein